MMQTLEKAVFKIDPKQVETAAHTLAGMLANLSASQPQTSTVALEQPGRNRESRGPGSAFAAFQRDLDAVTASTKFCLGESYA